MIILEIISDGESPALIKKNKAVFICYTV